MPSFLVLRLAGPLMSFGSVAVDAIGVTDDHPGASMLVGLLGNALGYDHRDTVQLARLQARLKHAVRADRPGVRMVDYQTVDLGQSSLLGAGWTTRGAAEGRGGAFSDGTHIRYRHYLADGVYTVAVQLDPAEEAPTLEDLAAAVARPARPLFLGRKSCPPSLPLLRGLRDAGSWEEVLRAEPMGVDVRGEVDLWLPAATPTNDGRTRFLADQRDWANQVHVGGSHVRLVRARLGDT